MLYSRRNLGLEAHSPKLSPSQTSSQPLWLIKQPRRSPPLALEYASEEAQNMVLELVGMQS